jgi:cell wall-associated NlpC family hydrolase
MLKCSKVILCSAVLNLSIFLTVSLSYADVDKNTTDQRNSNFRDNSIISLNIENMFKNSQATIEENIGNWYKVSLDGKSGWMYGEVFPVEIIKASQDAKSLEQPEAPTQKSQDEKDKKDEEKASTTVESTDENNEEVQQEVDPESEEATNQADADVDGSNKSETLAAVIEGIITGDNVNIRKGPGTDHEAINQVNTSDKVEILGKSSDWYNIRTKDGVEGWIYSQYVSYGSSFASRGETSNSDTSDMGTKIIAYAKDLLGVKYVYGGTSRKGFDCSGFVWYVYNNFGIKLNRVASDQAKQGTKVSKSKLQPGDLVFFDTNGGMNHINHVGIYIGNGSFIHASSGSKAKKVVISDINSGFYNGCYMTARRIIK